MSYIERQFPDYRKYFHGSSDPVRKMGSKKKGKVLVQFLKDAMKQDWKHGGEVRSLIDFSITVLQEKKDKDKLSKRAKREFKELRNLFKSECQAAEAAKPKDPFEEIRNAFEEIRNAFESELRAEAAKPQETFEEAAKRLEALIMHKITNTPLAFQLYNEACAVQREQFAQGRNGSPNVQISVVAKLPSGAEPQMNGGCWAECHFFNGSISLLQQGEDEMISSALFELCNIKKQARNVALISWVMHGIIQTADRYAYETELIEYGSVQEHCEIMEKIIQQNGWPASMNSYSHLPKTFSEWWPKVKDSYHADCYRKQFMRMAKTVKV